MLPVVARPDAVTRRIVGYSWAMVAASLAAGAVRRRLALRRCRRWCSARGSSPRRTGCTAGCVRGEAPQPLGLFRLSITYLSLLFAAVAVSQFV